MPSLDDQIKKKQDNLFKCLSKLPGFEECENFNSHDLNIEKKFKKYVSKYSKEAPKLDKKKKYNETIAQIREIVTNIKYLQAEERGVFIGVGPWLD